MFLEGKSGVDESREWHADIVGTTQTTCSLVCFPFVCVHSNRKGTNTFQEPRSPGMLSPGLLYGQAYTALKTSLSSRGQQELPKHRDVI